MTKYLPPGVLPDKYFTAEQNLLFILGELAATARRYGILDCSYRIYNNEDEYVEYWYSYSDVTDHWAWCLEDGTIIVEDGLPVDDFFLLLNEQLRRQHE